MRTWWDEELDEVEQLTDLDMVLQIAEAKRAELIENFSDLGFQEAQIAAGTVGTQAHWTWTFLLSTTQTVLTTLTIELNAEGICVYSAEVVVNSKKGYSASGVVEVMQDAPSEAFQALYELYTRIGAEQ